jgi:hypothetical protein
LGILTAQAPADCTGTTAGAFLVLFAICSLLLWVSSANTIMTGGYLLRKRRKHSYEKGLPLTATAFGSETKLASQAGSAA